MMTMTRAACQFGRINDNSELFCVKEGQRRNAETKKATAKQRRNEKVEKDKESNGCRAQPAAILVDALRYCLYVHLVAYLLLILLLILTNEISHFIAFARTRIWSCRCPILVIDFRDCLQVYLITCLLLIWTSSLLFPSRLTLVYRRDLQPLKEFDHE